MGYVITFIYGALIGLLAMVCCAMAGQDDEWNGRK